MPSPDTRGPGSVNPDFTSPRKEGVPLPSAPSLDNTPKGAEVRRSPETPAHFATLPTRDLPGSPAANTISTDIESITLSFPQASSGNNFGDLKQPSGKDHLIIAASGEAEKLEPPSSDLPKSDAFSPSPVLPPDVSSSLSVKADTTSPKENPASPSISTGERNARELGLITTDNTEASAIVGTILGVTLPEEPALVVLTESNKVVVNTLQEKGVVIGNPKKIDNPWSAWNDPESQIIFMGISAYVTEPHVRIHETAHPYIDHLNPQLADNVKQLLDAFSSIRSSEPSPNVDIEKSTSARLIHEGVALWIEVNSLASSSSSDKTAAQNYYLSGEINDGVTINEKYIDEHFTMLRQSIDLFRKGLEKKDWKAIEDAADLERKGKYVVGHYFIHTIMEHLRDQGASFEELQKSLVTIIQHPPETLDGFRNPLAYIEKLKATREAKFSTGSATEIFVEDPSPQSTETQFVLTDLPRRFSEFHDILRKPSFLHGITATDDEGFYDLLGEPFGSGDYYTTLEFLVQLAMALHLSKHPQIDDIMSRGGPQAISDLRRAKVLTGIKILDLGCGQLPSFALAAKALGAEVHTVGSEPLDPKIVSQLDSHTIVNLNDPDAAEQILAKTGGNFMVISENIPEDPEEIFSPGFQVVQKLAERLGLDNGWYFRTEKFYQKKAKNSAQPTIDTDVPPKRRIFKVSIPRQPFVMFPWEVYSNLLAEAIVGNNVYIRDRFGARILPSREKLLAEFNSQSLTEFGHALKNSIEGRTVIDLGCGDPTTSHVPRTLSRAFGAQAYIGIDTLNALPNTDSQNPTQVSTDFTILYKQADMLNFLSTLPPQNGVVFYLSGIEPENSKDKETQQYIASCLTEMQRVTQKGDAIVIGAGTHGFDPQKYGFTLTQSVTTTNRFGDSYISQRIYVKE